MSILKTFLEFKSLLRKRRIVSLASLISARFRSIQRQDRSGRGTGLSMKKKATFTKTVLTTSIAPLTCEALNISAGPVV